MFNFLHKNQKGEEVMLKIGGMHCPSCSLNIDDTLEELDGVFESNTSYAKALTKVRIDPGKVKRGQLEQKIQTLGYKVL